MKDAEIQSSPSTNTPLFVLTYTFPFMTIKGAKCGKGGSVSLALVFEE
jgi:hypothetical protein